MASNNSFLDVWKTAVHEYETQTERKVDRDATFQKFKTLHDLEQYIDQKQDSFDSFREEHGKLFSRMAKCFQPLVPILDVAQKGMQATPYAPAAIALGAVSYLLQACEKVTKCYDAVEELFGQIENITMRLKAYEHDTMEASLKSKMAEMLAYILEIIGKTEKVVRRKRIKQWARSIFMDDDEISPSLKKLRKFAEDELGLVMALTFARVGTLQNTAEEVKKGVGDILNNQQSERLRAFNEADEKRIADALKTEATHHIAAKYASSAEALTKGTGVWIKDDPMFQAWEEESAPILWVFGRPGVGKTMLATRTIEVLKTRFPQHPDIPSLTSVSYLYFKDDNPHLRDCTQMWKAAASQIVTANDRFKKHVLSVLKQNDVFASSRRAWELLFLDFFTEVNTTQNQTSLAYIIVDGLDEAPEGERVKFLACLSELTKRVTDKTRCRIQIAIFARPDVRADAGFDKIGSYRSGRIVITPDRNSKDIGAFIKQNLGEVLVLKLLRKKKTLKEYESLAKHIFFAVQNRSQGMFLWASLVFHQIRDLPSSEAVRTALAQAPDGLDDMLHHVFKRLDNEEQMRQTYLRELLTWVLCTYRPLTIAELFVLLRLTAGQSCVTIKQDLISRYSSIFDVSGPSGEDAEEVSVVDQDEQEQQSDSGDDDFDFLDDMDGDGVESIDDSTDDAGEDETDEVGSSAQEEASIAGVENMISDSWRNSVVTFTHARIRDYLTTECDPKTRRWNDCSLFMHDLNESKQRIVAACLNILLSNIAATHEVDNLIWYARMNWARHLLNIDCGETGSDLSIKLARGLASIFNDGKCFLRSSFGIIDNFTAMWFETDKYIKVARRLVAEHVEHLDDCHRAWGERVKRSSRALFDALVHECATTWLTKKGFDDPAYLDKSEFESWVLYAFNSLSDDGVDEDNAPVFYYGGTIPLDDIETIANLVTLPKNEHWYTGVAWIMMEAEQPQYTARAIDYFNKAREMADGAWVALEGLAVCHGISGLYKEAVEFMQEAIAELPKSDEYEGIDFHLRSKMGAWQRKLGDPEEALQVTKRAYEGSLDFYYPSGSVADHHIRLSIRNYIEAMYDMDKHEDIMHFLQELDQRTTRIDVSMWIVFLRSQFDDLYDIDLFGKLGTITRSQGRSLTASIIKGSVERAVPLKQDVFSDTGSLWLIVQCITWLYEFSGERKYAVELCRKVIALIDASDETTQQNSWWYRDEVAAILGAHCLKTAMADKAAGMDTDAITAELDSLAHHQQGSKKYVRASYPALFMGEWLHEHTSAKDEDWMKYIRPSVKRALHLLSDNDPWNDQQAYAQLGQALLCANDIGNARIALGITMKPLEKLVISTAAASSAVGEAAESVDEDEAQPGAAEAAAKDNGDDWVDEDAQTDLASDSDTQPPTKGDEIEDDSDEEHDGAEQPDNIKYAGFRQMWSCNGCLTTRNKSSDPYHELHFCRICADVCFCEDCIGLLREGKLDDYTICSSTHQLAQIFPVSKEARGMTDALLEKRFDVQQDWLAGLWKVWGDGEGEP